MPVAGPEHQGGVLTDAEPLDAAVVRTWARLAVEALGRAREALDGVNVFPVADGDTGTNMHLTLREAAHATHAAPGDAGGARLLRVAARGALLGARGSSGVILSEWLRGLAVAATRREPLAVALDAAARNARRAVAHPEPGTILTAADVAAAAAREAAAAPGVGSTPGGGRQAVLDAARRGAREAALSSVGTLAALRAAGVLDAGACGLVLVLHALAEAQRVAGGGMSEAPASMAPVTLDMDLHASAGPGEPLADGPPGGRVAGVPAADGEELELMFVLHRPAGAADFAPGGVAEALRAELAQVGNSVVVVGGGQDDDGDADGPDADGPDAVWQAHVHTPDLDAALAVPRRWAARGAVSHVHVRHLAVPPVGWGVVAATGAPRLAADLARGGAVVLLALDVPVSSDDLAQAALGGGARRVLVLPGPVPGAAADVPAALAARLAEAGDDDVEAVVVDAADDARVATAVAVAADAVDAAAASGDADVDVPAAVRSALGRLRTAATDAARCGPALAELLDGRAPVIATALVDDGVAPAAVAELERVAAAAAGAELVVLPTGRPGTGVTLCVEEQEG